MAESKIMGLFANPEDIRQRQRERLLNEGRQSAGMLMQGGGSGLAQAIKGYGANVAQYMPLQADRMKRGLMGAAAEVAGLQGNEEGRRAIQMASKSPQEQEAIQARQLLQGANTTSVKGLEDAIERALKANRPDIADLLTARLAKVRSAAPKAASPYGKRASDEGLSPGTPEFVARMKELEEADRAQDDPSKAPQSKYGKVASDLGYTIGTEEYKNKVKSLQLEDGKESTTATNQRWALDEETGESILVGTNKDGKLVRVTPEGNVPAPSKIKPVKQVTKVENLADGMTQLGNQANKLFSKDLLRYEGIQEMKIGLKEVTGGNEQGVNTLARSLVKIAGPDGTISKAEVEGVLGQGDIATRVANTFSIGIKGVPTQQTLADIAEFVGAYDKYITKRLNTKVSRWKNSYEGTGEALETAASNIAQQYNTGYSPSAQKYIEQARQGGS